MAPGGPAQPPTSSPRAMLTEGAQGKEVGEGPAQSIPQL